MKTARLIAWVRRAGDDRDSASDVAEAAVRQDQALVIARAVDAGDCPADVHFAISPQRDDERRRPELAVGHGVVVVYRAGRSRLAYAE